MKTFFTYADDPDDLSTWFDADFKNADEAEEHAIERFNDACISGDAPRQSHEKTIYIIVYFYTEFDEKSEIGRTRFLLEYEPETNEHNTY